jgi:hypothetical protein
MKAIKERIPESRQVKHPWTFMKAKEKRIWKNWTSGKTMDEMNNVRNRAQESWWFDSMDSMMDRIHEISKLGEDNKWKWGQER